MKDILIVSDNQDHFNILNNQLGHTSIHFSWGGELSEALKFAPVENPAYILFMDENPRILSEWLDDYNQSDVKIPFICCSRRMSAEERRLLWDKGAKDILQFPVNRKELEHVLHSLVKNVGDSSAESDEMRGNLQDFNLIDLIQTFQDGQKNGVLHLQKATQKGRIEFNKGKMVNARLARREPMESLEVMATWFSGQFWTRLDRKKHTSKIELSNQEIIIECLSHVNKQQQLLNELPNGSQVLYASPKLDYEEIGPTNRNILLLFKDGYSINKFLEQYTDKTTPVLEKIKKWIKEDWLLDQEQLGSSTYRKKDKQKSGGLFGMMTKVFTKDHGDKAKRIKTDNKEPENVDEAALLAMAKVPHLFNNIGLLEEFAGEVKKLT